MSEPISTAEAISVLTTYYVMISGTFTFCGLLSIHDKETQRFKTLMGLGFLIVWPYYLFAAFRGIARHLYYTLRHNRTYKQELERREEFVRELKGT